MTKRPSFQFYPADWSANPNLKRCTFAEKGIWLEVMCLLHDQAEYGVLRWTLQEIAAATKCRPADLRSLHRKGVMKGDDFSLVEPFIYVPRSGRKDGPAVTLVPAQEGPIWFSSRMVRDEYVRSLRADGGGAPETPKPTPKSPPKPPFGATIHPAFGPRTSSSSSSEEGSEDKSSGADSAAEPDLDQAAWAAAVKVLTIQGGMTDKDARSFFGKLLAGNGIRAKEMLSATADAMVTGTLDPKAYLTRIAQRLGGRQRAAQPAKRVGFV